MILARRSEIFLALTMAVVSTNTLAAGKKKSSSSKPAASTSTPAPSADIPASAPIASSESVAAEVTPPASEPSSTRSHGPGSLVAHPSPYEDVIDQHQSPLDPPAAILRVGRPFFGLSYLTQSGSYKASADSAAVKYNVDGTSWGFQGIYPTPVGIRVGGFYSQNDAKVKISTDTLSASSKITQTDKGILVAGAFQNGFGVGIALHDVEEKITTSTDRASVSVDEHYGYILPSVYYGGKADELILTWKRSMRHRTFTKDGYFDLAWEHGFGGQWNSVASIRNNRRSENNDDDRDDDDERDNFEGQLGARYFLNQKSNIVALVGFAEPHYEGPEDADVFSVMQENITVLSTYFFAPEHVGGLGVSYDIYEGKGEEIAGSRLKLSGSDLGMVLSYSYRM